MSNKESNIFSGKDLDKDSLNVLKERIKNREKTISDIKEKRDEIKKEYEEVEDEIQTKLDELNEDEQELKEEEVKNEEENLWEETKEEINEIEKIEESKISEEGIKNNEDLKEEAEKQKRLEIEYQDLSDVEKVKAKQKEVSELEEKVLDKQNELREETEKYDQKSAERRVIEEFSDREKELREEIKEAEDIQNSDEVQNAFTNRLKQAWVGAWILWSKGEAWAKEIEERLKEGTKEEIKEIKDWLVDENKSLDKVKSFLNKRLENVNQAVSEQKERIKEAAKEKVKSQVKKASQNTAVRGVKWIFTTWLALTTFIITNIFWIIIIAWLLLIFGWLYLAYQGQATQSYYTEQTIYQQMTWKGSTDTQQLHDRDQYVYDENGELVLFWSEDWIEVGWPWVPSWSPITGYFYQYTYENHMIGAWRPWSGLINESAFDMTTTSWVKGPKDNFWEVRANQAWVVVHIWRAFWARALSRPCEITLYNPETGYYTYYLHLSDVNSSLNVGDVVGYGTIMWKQGNQCWWVSMAHHLHYQIFKWQTGLEVQDQPSYLKLNRAIFTAWFRTTWIKELTPKSAYINFFKPSVVPWSENCANVWELAPPTRSPSWSQCYVQFDMSHVNRWKVKSIVSRLISAVWWGKYTALDRNRTYTCKDWSQFKQQFYKTWVLPPGKWTLTERREYFLKSRATPEYQNLADWQNVANKGKIDVDTLICWVAIENSKIWVTKWAYNVWNVLNTDSAMKAWKRTSFPSKEAWMMAIVDKAWNWPYLKNVSTLYDASVCWWAKYYYSSAKDWYWQLLGCISGIRGQNIPLDYNFRRPNGPDVDPNWWATLESVVSEVNNAIGEAKKTALDKLSSLVSWHKKIWWNYDFNSDSSFTKYINQEISFNNPRYKPIDLVQISWKNIILWGSKWWYLLRSEAHTQLNKMADWLAAAWKWKMTIASSYRSYDYQHQALANCKGDLTWCAKPGHSEHQTWLAVDLFAANSDARPKYANQMDWVDANAHKYWFSKSYTRWLSLDWYHAEWWHFRYVWVELATELYNAKKNFTQFYQESKK